MKFNLSNINLSTAFVIILTLILIDQASKFYIKLNFELSSYGSNAIVDWGFFKLLFIENKGMAWGTKINDFIPFLSEENGKLFLTLLRVIAIIFIGKIFRTSYPKAKTLIEVIRLRFGKHIFKLILILSIFYMTIFLIAEVTAVSILINYISGTKLWITALIVISSSLIYTLYGGLRASIFTDNIQFIVFTLLLLIAFSYLFSFNTNEFSFEFINKNKPNLLSKNYFPNFTAGLTFFIAVAATNLFHQGNWQRVYACLLYTSPSPRDS